MSDIDIKLASAGEAHHAAIERLLEELRNKASVAAEAEKAIAAAELARAEAERAKSEAEEDKARVASYLEAVTLGIHAQLDEIAGKAASVSGDPALSIGVADQPADVQGTA